MPQLSATMMGACTVVFIPKDGEPGDFEVREVELGGVADGYQLARV